MSRHQDHNRLLQKLIDGHISQKERHQLQKASLDDPFLAEALEGYALNDFDAQKINTLKESLKAKRTRKTRIWPWAITGIAATLVLLLAFSQLFLLPKDEAAIDLMAETIQDKKTTSVETVEQQMDHDEGIIVEESNPVTLEKTTKEAKDLSIKKNQNKAIDPSPSPAAQMDDLAIEAKAKTFKKQNVPAIEPASKALVESKAPAKDKMLMEDEAAVVENNISIKESKEESTDPLTDSDWNQRVGNSAVLEESVVVSKSKKRTKAQIPVVKNLPPTKVVGLISDMEGKPLKGVNIFDTKQNLLTFTDETGQFEVDNPSGYLISAISGYDTMTISVRPALSIQMQKSAVNFAEPHKRLVDLMDDTELAQKYTNDLNEHFSRYWPICETDFRNGQVERVRNNLTVNVVLNNYGRITDLDFFEDVDSECSSKIQEIFMAAQMNNLFAEGRAMQFRYRINL